MFGEVIENLVSNGHNIKEVVKYTMTQCLVFHSFIIKRKKEEHLSFLTAIRAGAWADDKGIQKYVRNLDIG